MVTTMALEKDWRKAWRTVASQLLKTLPKLFLLKTTHLLHQGFFNSVIVKISCITKTLNSDL